MERRHLEYFVAVIDHRGFTNAAHARYVAQPSLSQAIKSLERELGVQLFYRLGHGVRLTAAGQALEGPARQALRDLEAARSAVLNVADLQSGFLDIVSIPGMAADPLPALIAPFHARYPGVVIRIGDPGSRDILDVVRSGTSELALTLPPARSADLGVTELEQQELFLALPPNSAQRHGSTLPVKELERLPLIVTPITKPLVNQNLQTAGVTPVYSVETAHRESMVPLVLAGLGVTFLTQATAKDARARGAVICRLDPPFMRRVVVVHRRAGLSPAATAFLELLQHPRPDPWDPAAEQTSKGRSTAVT